MRNIKMKLLVGLLALASPYAAMAKTLQIPAGTLAANGPLANAVTFAKILNYQSTGGSNIFLTASNQSDIFAITRVTQGVQAGVPALTEQGFAIKNPTQINNNGAPTAAAAGPAFVNPLFDQAIERAVIFGDYIAAVSTNGHPGAGDKNQLFLVPISNPTRLITTAYNNALVAAGGNVNPGTAVYAPTINFQPPLDAAGLATQEIKAVAAGKDGVFAAVSEAGANFTLPGNNRGIAKLVLKNNVLEQAKLNSANPNNVQAAPLSLVAVSDGAPTKPTIGAVFFNNAGVGGIAGEFVSIYPGAINPGVVLHYDKDLDRLFVGLKGLRKNDVANPGGLVGVLVGQPNAANPGTIDLRSIFHEPTKALLEDGAANNQNRHDRILGIYHDQAGGGAGGNRVAQTRNAFVSIHHLKTMKTSTGRNYLIVGSEVGGVARGVANTQRSSGLYFVPLMPKTAAAEQVGKVAQAAFGAVAGAMADLPLAGLNCISNTVDILDNAESRVRTVPLLAASRGNSSVYVSELHVVGDSVLVSVFTQGIDASRPVFRGVYQTTALFNATGEIVGWTPLQRLSGVSESASGVEIDRASGTVMALSSDRETFTLADWGQNRVATAELQKLIAKHFPASRGGVRAIHAFDGSTPTFRGGLVRAADVNLLQRQQCALLVVLGYSKVMVVQTAFINRPAAHFKDDATVNTFGIGTMQNVFVFDNQALKDIAPLTCAEVLKVVRNADSTEGYLYVGGYNGMCRLQTGAGAGWAIRAAGALTGLNRFDNDAAGLDFVKLNNPQLKDVRRIVSTIGTAGAVADADGTRVVAVLGDGFVVAAGNQLDFAPVVKTTLANVGPIFDGVLVKYIAAQLPVPPAVGVAAAAVAAAQSRLILATEKGLVVKEDLTNANIEHKVILANGDLPIQLSYVARTRGGVTGGHDLAGGAAGMLYVLAGSQVDGKMRVHRYALQFAGANAVLQAGNVTPFDVQTFRRYFATDGMQFLFGHDAALDSSEVLNQMLFASRGSAPYPLTYALGNVGLDTFTGAAVREPVTGTWLVPGSFGVVAND